MNEVKNARHVSIWWRKYSPLKCCLITIWVSLSVLSISACDQAEKSSPPLTKQSIVVTQPSEEHIVVTDFANNTLRLYKPAKRIVALAPHIVENLYSIGAGNLIVGVVQHSDFPAEASKHPIVGGYEKIDYEKIMALRPDLIIAWGSGNSHSHTQKLKELGLTVLVDQPDSLNDIAHSLRLLGMVTGTYERADTVADAFLSTLKEKRAESSAKRPVSVFYQVWNNPLITINGHHIISDAIKTCGGVNVFSDSVAVAPRTNIESVIARNPEAIIVSGTADTQPTGLNEWLQWGDIEAVQQQNLFYVNPDHLQRHTQRQLLAIETICAQLDHARTK